jgi:hypothetical protein
MEDNKDPIEAETKQIDTLNLEDKPIEDDTTKKEKRSKTN